MSSFISTLSCIAVSLLAASSLSLAASADPSGASAAKTPEVVAAFRNLIFKQVDGSFKRLVVSCISEKGQPAANCTLLYLDIGKEEVVVPQTEDQVKASALSSYADSLRDPEKFCKESQVRFTESLDVEEIQDAPIFRAFRQISSACTKSTADGLRAFKKIYPRAEVWVGEILNFDKAMRRLTSNICIISAKTYSYRFILESDTQLRYEYRYKEPWQSDLGFEIVLFKNTSTDQWNVLHQSIRADTAPASYKGSVDRYSPAGDKADYRRMDCKYIGRN